MDDTTQDFNVEEPPPLPTSFDTERPSGKAKASFVIGLVSVGIFVFVIALSVAAAFRSGTHSRANTGGHAGMESNAALFMVVGLLMFSNIILNFVGLILGIVALQKSIPNKWMAVTGIVINGVAAALLIAIIVLCLSMAG